MTTFVAIASQRAIEARGDDRDVPDGVRIAFMVATLLLVWVRLAPFHDLTSVSNIEASDGGNQATQIAFTILGFATAYLLYRFGPAPLRALRTGPILLLAGWLCVSIAFSVAPGVSLRRAILLVIVVLAAATLTLAARSVRDFANVLAGTALGVVAVCFISLVIVPDLAMHTALDLREPEHAGAWRGLFGHKNEAGAMMVIFIFTGLFTARAGNRMLGIALTTASAIFLAFTISKTAVALLPAVLLSTSLCVVLRRPWLRVAILVGPIACLLLVSLGSLFFPPVKAIVSSVLPDASFTGRTEIWEFTAEHILERPIVGWGYGAFWKTEATLYGGSEQLTWVNQADQAHNGYLDIALFMGLPGLAFAMLALVAAPLRDFLLASADRPPTPLAMYFLRLWLFGLSSAAFESVLFDGSNTAFVMLVMSVLGLRFMRATRVIA